MRVNHKDDPPPPQPFGIERGRAGSESAEHDSFEDIDEDSKTIGTCVALYAFQGMMAQRLTLRKNSTFFNIIFSHLILK